MKTIKMLGLAAIAALAATAFLGAGSASATVLCGGVPEEGVCSAEEGLYYTTLNTSAKNVKFAEAGFAGNDLICKTSELEVQTNSAGGEGEAIAAEVVQLNFGGCKTTGSDIGCSITVYNLPYEASIEHTEGNDGRLTASNGGSGEPGFFMSCFGSTCQYRFGTFTLPLNGGSPASLVASSVAMTKLGGWCGGGVTNSSWTGTYTIAEPSAVYVASS